MFMSEQSPSTQARGLLLAYFIRHIRLPDYLTISPSPFIHRLESRRPSQKNLLLPFPSGIGVRVQITMPHSQKSESRLAFNGWRESFLSTDVQKLVVIGKLTVGGP